MSSLRLSESFFWLSTIPTIIQMSEESSTLAQKRYFYLQGTNNQSWKDFKFKLLPWIKYLKQCLQKNIKFGTLAKLACFIFLLKLIEMVWSYKKCQKSGDERGLRQSMIKSFLPRLSWTKYLYQNWVIK